MAWSWRVPSEWRGKAGAGLAGAGVGAGGLRRSIDAHLCVLSRESGVSGAWVWGLAPWSLQLSLQACFLVRVLVLVHALCVGVCLLSGSPLHPPPSSRRLSVGSQP